MQVRHRAAETPPPGFDSERVRRLTARMNARPATIFWQRLRLDVQIGDRKRIALNEFAPRLDMVALPAAGWSVDPGRRLFCGAESDCKPERGFLSFDRVYANVSAHEFDEMLADR